jgi:streptogramin lyase/predicted Ser/Thr protein kinase
VSVSVDPRIGSELFGYRVEALLGRGGMSVVYRAHDLALDRKVALKLLAPELAGDERFRARFLRESRVAASLDHPNVVPIYEAGEAEGLLCIAMRYVEGTDLKRLLREEGVLEPERALDYGAQVAAALDTAHGHGLVHRDVKPSNVLITPGGHCYLADFGLTYSAAERSDLTQTGHLLGTVDYAAPEQIEGKPVDGRADVYSLGCLLYECLTGAVPFGKDSDLAVLWAHVNEPPPGLASYPELEPVLKRALAKRPDGRYPTCGALVAAARDALPKPEAPTRSRRYALIGVGAAVLAGGLAAGLALAFGGGADTAKADLTVRAATLVRIDPETEKIAAVIPITGVPDQFTGPVDVSVGGRFVWVYDWNDRTLRAADSRTNTVERIVAVGFPPGTGSALAADSGGVWAVSSKEGSGVLTRASSGIALPRDFRLDYRPLAVAAGAGAVWVAASSPTAEVVLQIDPATGKVRHTERLPGAEIRSIAVGEGAIWTLQSGTITRLDPATGRVTRRVPLPAYQVGQIAAGHRAVWVTLQEEGGGSALARLDPRTFRISRTAMPTGQNSGTITRVAIDKGAVWWDGADNGNVWRVDPKTGKIVSAVRVTPGLAATTDILPVSVAAGADGVWVTVGFGP